MGSPDRLPAPEVSGTGPAGSKRIRELMDWIEVPSISGGEQDFCELVTRALTARGASVEAIEVGDGRRTLFAREGHPRVVLCTHLDTVPPWIGARADRTHVHGRGACDAKGIALAMLEALDRLPSHQRASVGLLFTVGEETDSDGARAADRALLEGRLGLERSPEFIVVGEPTANRFIRGHRGMLRAALEATGVAGHSSQPGGVSAVHGLTRCCGKVLDLDWGQHPLFGRGSVNIGTFHGGAADNVFAPRARAELLVRSVRHPAEDERLLRELLDERLRLEVSCAYPPVEFHVPDSQPGADVVAFGTDAPFLGAWGRPLLVGPGQIELAHTADERIGIDEVAAGVERYRGLLESLLA